MLTEFSRDFKTIDHFSVPFEHNEKLERNWLAFPKIAASSEEQARKVWAMMEPDEQGNVEVHSFSYLLGSFGLPHYEVEKTIHIYKGESGKINFEKFYKEMGYLWRFVYFEG